VYESSQLEEPGVNFCYLSEPELRSSVTVVVSLLFLFFSLAGTSEQKSEGSVCWVLIPAVSVFCCEFVVYPCYERRSLKRVFPLAFPAAGIFQRVFFYSRRTLPRRKLRYKEANPIACTIDGKTISGGNFTNSTAAGRRLRTRHALLAASFEK